MHHHPQIYATLQFNQTHFYHILYIHISITIWYLYRFLDKRAFFFSSKQKNEIKDEKKKKRRKKQVGQGWLGGFVIDCRGCYSFNAILLCVNVRLAEKYLLHVGSKLFAMMKICLYWCVWFSWLLWHDCCCCCWRCHCCIRLMCVRRVLSTSFACCFVGVVVVILLFHWQPLALLLLLLSSSLCVFT